MARLAWFSPMAPARTGVAVYSAELVAALGQEHEIDLFADEPSAASARGSSRRGRLNPTDPPAGRPPTPFARYAARNQNFVPVASEPHPGLGAPRARPPERSGARGPRERRRKGVRGTKSPGLVRSAHEFVWSHHLEPYDLTVFQLGNSSAHDFLWPYLFRYPGLAVLHDSHLHHARAAALLRSKRTSDYRAEFSANHPDVSPDLAELAIAGFDSHLYYSWSMTRLTVRCSRLVAVHAPLLAEPLQDESPGAEVEPIRLGHGELVPPEQAALAAARVRARHGVPEGAVLFGLLGGLTPEKRVAPVLEAFAALLRYEPAARLILAGASAAHYDVAADVRRLGLDNSVILTGYIDSDEAFTEYVSACDISINLRWPTAREISGPWLRALAAGRPTITMDLSHMADVAALDPRTWTMTHGGTGGGEDAEPVTVAIDILDEDHSLRVAMRRLASDAGLRGRLGRAAAAYWEREHSMPRMLEDYRRLLARAMAAPVPDWPRPSHLDADGTRRLHELLEPFGLAADPWSRI